MLEDFKIVQTIFELNFIILPVSVALEAAEAVECWVKHQSSLNSSVAANKHSDLVGRFESSVNPRRDDEAGWSPKTGSLDYPFCF